MTIKYIVWGWFADNRIYLLGIVNVDFKEHLWYPPCIRKSLKSSEKKSSIITLSSIPTALSNRNYCLSKQNFIEARNSLRLQMLYSEFLGQNCYTMYLLFPLVDTKNLHKIVGIPFLIYLFIYEHILISERGKWRNNTTPCHIEVKQKAKQYFLLLYRKNGFEETMKKQF